VDWHAGEGLSDESIFSTFAWNCGNGQQRRLWWNIPIDLPPRATPTGKRLSVKRLAVIIGDLGVTNDDALGWRWGLGASGIAAAQI
jgi:hypothetical protein